MKPNADDLKNREKAKGAVLWEKMNEEYRILGRVYRGVPGTTFFARFADPAETESYKKLVHLGSYNYSGLNNDIRIIQVATDAIQKYGVTSSGVRLLNGTSDVHLDFEKALAAFLGVEEAVTYSSGYLTNISALGCLCYPEDLVFSDRLNHQSIVDGLALSQSTVIKYNHNDMVDLEKKLSSHVGGKNAKKFIVTDSIFSMDGDIADLKSIVSLAKKYGCYVIVDEAHATAAYGPNGRGVVAALGLIEDVDLILSSLSKGLPGIGGFAAGKKSIISILRYSSHGYVFSASLPPSTLAGLTKALEILTSEPKIQDKLRANADYLRTNLIKLGFHLGNSETAIIPVLLTDIDTTCRFTKLLQEAGVYANPVTFPAVPIKLPRLRLNVSAALTQEELDFAINAFKEVGYKLGVIQINKGDSVGMRPKL
ncbi:MAG: aminotransferase class I/II-fold pyridoxal phosphate-dependent enzyme [Proteobacteria bacterium]|nr:aminotransferase class I/II-fold pyridoxal phosphate-dependent enzyme [Pseudomonadota bacterium]